MLRSIGLAALLALGISGGILTVSSAQAGVVPPGAAVGGATASESAGGLVTPVWHHGRPHFGRPHHWHPRAGYRQHPTRCRVVVKSVRTEYGWRRVKRRICRY
jgi:hypothetical protein